ncbi:hypothetical protein GCM10010486_05840 [Nonomuraea roseoviolacea subsp. carminata]|uniref:ATPase/DNA-binding SARP family transcriptional activator n=1 Tax=Nonomuraea roseoviolacea subsp. carminata TaxID=160689 RepID=A0ABT1K9L9_9ACTN|nr:putative ATPase/DNA-binding SARP family transcriptional activator [Nonomuraea roseoviolacea subsp. carminata]
MTDASGPGGDGGRVRVGILGPLTLETSSASAAASATAAAAGPARVGGARLRALLARLALDAGRSVQPATLVEALWGETEPAGHLHALQSLASRLRGVLGDPGLLTSGPAGYRLAVEPEAVDAVRFERLARAGRRALALSRPAEAAATLREALGLWRGPALADVREAPFAAADAERLERARLSALEDRVEADLALGADPDLVAELESLAAAHPLRERLHAQLVRALALNGRGAEALAAYERIRGLLADSFGSDPGPRLQEAHLAVLRGELRERPRLPRRTHGNLDVPLTSFVGRDDDVRRVTGLLGRVRLVTLVGPAGAGKTRLAGAVCRRLTPSGGVWFVPLAPAGAEDVPRVVLDLLRAREHGVPARPVTPGAAVDHLAETLADDELVLVLDNCEHVIEAAARLAAALLGRCPRLRVLATSREPLRIDGETLHPVLPLELPEPGATAERAAAVRLFRDRAAAVRPDFALEGTALAAAVEICRRLDGLPLAIELAAARLRTLPVEAVAARLDDRFRLLTGGSRTALPRHRTLDAAVSWSWDLLDGEDRMLLERLSVVPGGFTEDAAAAIGGWDGCTAPATEATSRPGDVRELLAALADKSLLHPVEPADPVEPRYRMLETIREYGLARLAQRDEVDAVRARHARFFLRLAETADPHLRTSDQLRWLARLSAERDNLSAAIRWTVESGDAGLAVRFGAALCWFWFLRDHPPESLDLLGRILQVRGPSEPRSRALVLAAHALATTEVISRPEEARAAFDRIREALDHAVPGSHPVVEMARLALAIGAGRDRAEQNVLDSQEESPHPHAFGSPDGSADTWSRSLSLLLQGVLAMNTGHAAEATHVLRRALTGFEEVGERWGLATTLSTLQSALLRSGEPGRGAPEPAERATRCFQELGMAEHTMENEVAAALHLARAGDVDGGRRRLSDLLDQAGRTGSAESLVQVRLGLARLEWRAGRPGAAREHAPDRPDRGVTRPVHPAPDRVAAERARPCGRRRRLTGRGAAPARPPGGAPDAHLAHAGRGLGSGRGRRDRAGPWAGGAGGTTARGRRRAARLGRPRRRRRARDRATGHRRPRRRRLRVRAGRGCGDVAGRGRSPGVRDHHRPRSPPHRSPEVSRGRCGLAEHGADRGGLQRPGSLGDLRVGPELGPELRRHENARRPAAGAVGEVGGEVAGHAAVVPPERAARMNGGLDAEPVSGPVRPLRVHRHGGAQLRELGGGQQPAGHQRPGEARPVPRRGHHRPRRTTPPGVVAGDVHVPVMARPRDVPERGRHARRHVGGVRFVAAGVGAAPGGAGGVVGVLEAERPGDPVPDQVGQARPGGLLQDGADRGVVGVAVRPSRPRREQRSVLHAQGEQPRRGPSPAVRAEERRPDRGVLGVVVQAAGVVEQHAQRDRRTAGDLARQPLLHRVGQGEPALGDQSQRERGHHGLGVGPHPVLVARLEQVVRPGPGGLFGDLDRRAAAVVHPYDHAGRPGVHQLARQPPQLSTLLGAQVGAQVGALFDALLGALLGALLAGGGRTGRHRQADGSHRRNHDDHARPARPHRTIRKNTISKK